MMNYSIILKEHDLKVTPQRLAIADIINVNGHVTIDFLYALMAKKFDSISLATIYKNINLMLKNSFIQEVSLPQVKNVYELTKASHSHLVCSKCLRVEDIDIDLDSSFKTVTKTTEFSIDSASLVFNGLCIDCKDN